MKITDFGKKTNVPQNKLKIQESVKPPAPAPEIEMIEEDIPPIFGITEEQMATVRRMRRSNPSAYARMIMGD
jgi:hypothetical protein